MAEQRLQQALALADLSPEALVETLLPTMFSATTPPEVVEGFGACLLAVRPAGFRAMAEASNVDLRAALPLVDVPTLLVYGDQDVRALWPVAEAMHAAIAGSTLVVLPGTGHVCNMEAPAEFNDALRSFLVEHGT